MKIIDNKEYIETKHKAFLEQYKDQDADLIWNALRSQINSGLNLGLGYEEIDKYAIHTLNYEQREIIKFALYAKLSAEQVDSLILNACENEENASLMLNEYDSYRYITFQEKNQLEKYQQLCELIEKQLSSKDEIKSLQDQIAILENKVANKDQELANIKRQYDDRIVEYEHKMNKLIDDSKNEKNKCNKVKTKRKKRIKLGCKAEKSKFGTTKLPDDFNLSTYLSKKNLSSSQLEIVTMAIRLNVKENTIYNLVEANVSAEQMKQMLEVIVAKQSMQEQAAMSVPVNEIELFTKNSD